MAINPVTADEIMWTHARIQHRIDAILERDGSVASAITGVGVSIGYLLASEIAGVLERAAATIEGLRNEPKRTPGTVEICEKPSCAVRDFARGCYKSGDERALDCPFSPTAPQTPQTNDKP